MASQGKPLFDPPPVTVELKGTVRMKSPTVRSLRIAAAGETYPIIEVVPEQIGTRKAVERIQVVNGAVVRDLERDILKLVVVERHNASGNVGVGLVRGFGLKKGALASSVAHDSHNVIAVGVDDLDILKAIEEIQRLQGGLVVCANLEILASLPLPIAGLLSPEPLDVVVSQHDKVEKAAASLGNLPPSPFAILSFLALPVIPELRLTDLGLVDVAQSSLID